MKKIVFIILDGLGDRPIEALGGKTPLEAAYTPSLDYMSEKGMTGLMQPFQFLFESHPTSEGTHVGMFGYKDYFLGRGPYEAAGINMPLYKGDIAFRVNFSTINEKGVILDRRAGRIKETKELIEALQGIEIKGIKFDIRGSNAHRAVLVLRGNNLSPEVTSNDPGEEGLSSLNIEAKNVGANFTADILNEYLNQAYKILNNLEFNKKRERPANYLLLRGAGEFKPIFPFKEKYGLNSVCVAGGGLYKGIARMIEMDVIEEPYFTADTDTDVREKVLKTKEALTRYDFVFLHFKGTDVCSHDGRYEDKKKFIEKIDKQLSGLLNIKDTLIVVTADHSTPCELKQHSKDPVPVLIYGDRKDEVVHFSEKEVKNGGLGIFPAEELLDKILKI
ncbi:MAG: 2,3-bisphosphoglycerate-independent phosphoglycerate mutase [Candidatus Pacebacteria bacterium]|nr:2,3-bisphosphoglycerate-independent phosphoglycerate mutase [Candidatus Paceibacterota bacterium]